MKNIVKTAGYSLVALTSIAYTDLFAGNSRNILNKQQAERLAVGEDNGGNIGTTITNIILYLLGFMALIAVIFAIYGGFQILTAGGDEEKVKKGKTTLINALIGIFVIWISWSVVSWIIGGLSDANQGMGN